jgi:hypothetical protein
MDLTTFAISTCTGVVSCHPKTTLHASPVHLHDTSDDKKTIGCWTHLPFYDDWKLCICYKCEKFLKANKLHLHYFDILIKATDLPTWYAIASPVLAESRVSRPEFWMTRNGYLPNQHPVLTRTAPSGIGHGAGGEKGPVATV